MISVKSPQFSHPILNGLMRYTFLTNEKWVNWHVKNWRNATSSSYYYSTISEWNERKWMMCRHYMYMMMCPISQAMLSVEHFSSLLYMLRVWVSAFGSGCLFRRRYRRTISFKMWISLASSLCCRCDSVGRRKSERKRREEAGRVDEKSLPIFVELSIVHFLSTGWSGRNNGMDI